mgnify:CR=1 FL=1
MQRSGHGARQAAATRLNFSVPNHGKLWKSLMRAHFGNYERIEARLRHATTITRRQKVQ